MTTTYIFDREPKESASDAARFGTRGNKPTKRQYTNDSYKKATGSRAKKYAKLLKCQKIDFVHETRLVSDLPDLSFDYTLHGPDELVHVFTF